MMLKHPSLFLLPILFFANFSYGYPVFEFVSLSLGFRKELWNIGTIVVFMSFNSIILFFWLFTLASKQPVYKHWKAVLALHLIVIFPTILTSFGAILLIWSIMAGSGLLMIVAPLPAVAVVLFVFLMGCRYLTKSQILSPFIGINFDIWHLLIYLASGATILFIDSFIFMTAFIV